MVPHTPEFQERQQDKGTDEDLSSIPRTHEQLVSIETREVIEEDIQF